MENYVIVLGNSAGGVSALNQLISQLPGTINTAVFAVLHLSSSSNAENITSFFQKHTSLTCTVPSDDTVIQKGFLYLAPANYHMMIKNDLVTINNGPHENKYRPSIDVLFRSAAVHYGSRVIGVILTGMLDDGTSGMSAIKRCGGICIVQEPSEAEFDQMPQSVINNFHVNYQVRLNDMAYVLKDLLTKPVPEQIPIPRELQVEAEITENMMT
jgi:two-component system, chemotaxis family, protein-glutamate methylesterase/glutaminase